MITKPRIHACLDGELPRHLLSASEEAELSALERNLAPVIDCLRSSAPVDLCAGVMQRLPQAAHSRAWSERLTDAFHGGWKWFWTPRPVTLRFRPSFAVAAIVLLSLLPLAGLQERGAEEPLPAIAAEAPPIYVQFRLDAAHAGSVSLAGTFSEWQPAIELQESTPGVWTATVPLTPGVYDYLFFVDGAEWVPDPAARRVQDDFGGTNSRLFLIPPSSTL